MSVKEGNVIRIPVEAIEPHPNNPRKNVGDVSELADSIKQSGLLQNLTVVPHPDESGRYRALIGHRRLAAAKQAGLEFVPCVVMEDMSLAEQVAIMVAENMQRQDLTIPEQVESIQLMIDLGMSVEEVSEKTGLGKSTVYKRRALSAFESAEFKKSAERGGTLQDYMKVAALKDEKAREKVLRAVGTNNFNMELNTAQNEEKKQERCELIESKLNEWATKVDNTNDLRVAAFRWISYFYDIDETDIKLIPPEGDKKYVYTKDHYNYIVYEVKAQTDELPKKTPEQMAMEKAKQERKERNVKFTELEEKMKQLRHEFVKNISPYEVEKRIFKIGAALIKALWYMNDQGLNVDVIKLMGFDPTDEAFEYLCEPCQNEESRRLSVNILEDVCSKNNTIAQILLFYIIALFEEFDLKNRYVGNVTYTKDEELMLEYEILKELGYQLSDEESAYLDGTHELYVKGE